MIAIRGLTVASPALALQGGSARSTPTLGARLGRRILVTGQVSPPLPGGFDFAKDGPGWGRFFEQLIDRVAALPGVTAVGAVSGLPLTGTAEGSSFVIVGQEPARAEDRPRTAYLVAAGDYFRAAGFAVAGALQVLLYGVGARDLGVYLGATAVVALVGLVATYLPARTAIKASPTEALRID